MSKKKKPSKTGLIRHHNHVIDQRAKTVLQQLVPAEWVLNPLITDYGKDYLVELTDPITGSIKGISFYIQQKGTEAPTIVGKGAFVSFPMEVAHLRYYCEELTLPVILIVVDTEKKRAWWLFVQEYMEELGNRWKSQSTISLRIRVANELSSIETFVLAVKNAFDYMRVNAATAHERLQRSATRMESRDPRFRVLPSATGTGTRYHLQARQPVDVGFKFHKCGPDAQQQLRDLIERGKPVEFLPGELTIEGSPLFNKAYADGGTLQFQRRIECLTKIACLGENDVEQAQLSGIRGELTGGALELELNAEIPRAPIQIELRSIRPGVKGTYRISVNFDRWNGQRLRTLAYFDAIETFLTGMATAHRLQFDCTIDGNPGCTVRAKNVQSKIVRFNSRVVELLKMARRVAIHFDVDPIFQIDGCLMGTDLIDAIAYLSVVENGEWTTDLWDGEFDISLFKPDEDIRCSDEFALIPSAAFSVASHTGMFMGVPIAFGPLEFEMDEVLSRSFMVDGFMRRNLKGTGKSTFTIRRAMPVSVGR